MLAVLCVLAIGAVAILLHSGSNEPGGEPVAASQPRSSPVNGTDATVRSSDAASGSPSSAPDSSAAAGLPAGHPRNLDEALELLKSDDKRDIAQALTFLARNPPGEPNREVAERLVSLLKAPSGGPKSLTLNALEQWAVPEQLPDLEPFLDHDDSLLQVRAAKAIARMGTVDAARAMVRRLSDPRCRVAVAAEFSVLGSVAEPAVLEQLESDDPLIRAEACQILGRIGTDDSLEKLRAATRDKDRRVAAAAKMALRRIGQ